MKLDDKYLIVLQLQGHDGLLLLSLLNVDKETKLSSSSEFYSLICGYDPLLDSVKL